MILHRALRGMALAVAALAWSPAFTAEPSTPPERIYVFGDSFSDIGAGYVDGDGPTAVAYMADELHLQMTYPGSSTAAKTSSLDFAVSGGLSDDSEGWDIREGHLGRGLGVQAAQFAKLARKRKIIFDAASAVAFIAIGINDGQLPTATTMQNITAAIATLYRAGLRRFVLADLPERIPEVKGVAIRLNPAIAMLRTQLQTTYADARFARSRWGGFFDQVFTAPDQYGITNKTPCLPRGATTPCTDPEIRFYYHSAHPSTAVHRIVGGMLAEEMRAQNW